MKKAIVTLAIALLLTLFIAPAGAQGIEISLSETAYDVRRGSFRNLTVWVGATGGYSGTVILKAENVPSGVTINFDGYPTKSGTPPFGSEVIIDVSSGVAVGEYIITFKADGEGGITNSTTYRLRVLEEYVRPEREVEEVELPAYVVGTVAVILAVVAVVAVVMVYSGMRARKEWAPAPPTPPS